MDNDNKISFLERVKTVKNRIDVVYEKIGRNWSRAFTILREKGDPLPDGISDSTISRLIPKIKDAIEGLGKGSADYCDDALIESWEEKAKHIEDTYGKVDFTSGITPASQEARDFLGSTWFLYFYYIKPGSSLEEPALGRAVLSIKKGKSMSEAVVCDNVTEDRVSKNYIGSYGFVPARGNNKYMMLYFDLRSKEGGDNLQKNRNQDNLYIKVTCSNYDDPISLGAYLTHEQNKITTGTVLLERISSELTGSSLPEPKIMSFFRNAELFNETKLAIRKFFSLKSLNYIKVSNDVHSLKQLENFVKKRELKKELFFFDEEAPVLFISALNSSIETKKREDNHAAIVKLKQVLEINFGENLKVDYHGGDLNKVEFIKNFDRNLERLKRTRFFVSILDGAGKNSFALAELGMALAFCSSILVFYKEGTISQRLGYLDGLGKNNNKVIFEKITDHDINALKCADVESLKKSSRLSRIYHSILKMTDDVLT